MDPEKRPFKVDGMFCPIRSQDSLDAQYAEEKNRAARQVITLFLWSCLDFVARVLIGVSIGFVLGVHAIEYFTGV